jgi:hypothetical protein
MEAIQHLFTLNQQGLHLLNEAFIVLIPKKTNPQRITDFRPISLIHSFAKIIFKILANRLAPLLPSLVSNNQTTFIKKRCIHASFIYVQEVVRGLHKKKTPDLFIKLDIFKAFDTVNWPYLLSIINHLGIGPLWTNWISMLWCTAFSTVLLNGERRNRIVHCRGVRQGDPLSPMLFLLVMEPLHMLFKQAQQQSLLHKLSYDCDVFRVSLYADDAALFINPSQQEMLVINQILMIFAEASGLKTNMAKTQCYPIQCQDVNLDFISTATLELSSFPCPYLGLPLRTRRPPRSAMQPLVQKIGDRLPG